MPHLEGPWFSMTLSRSARVLSVLAMTAIFTLGAVESADARRGGGFGSRGMRTYSAPRATAAAPTPAAPIQRSMTPQNQATRPAAAANRPAAANAAQQQRGNFLRRWGGPILGGLLAAGLFGMLMGGGFGGAAGIMAMLVQVGLIALIAAAAFAFFRRRKAAHAGAHAAGPAGNVSRFEFQQPAAPMQQAYTAPAAAAAHDGDEIGVGQGDFDAFEQLLGEVQTAFGREDYAALRERTTPEIMSYLAEELSQNAVAGRRNDVTDVRLLQGDLSEAWTEDSRDYATVAMRYSSVDVMRDRATGALVEGEERPTETTEMWTFVRDREGPWGAGWKLSAIQELQPA